MYYIFTQDSFSRYTFSTHRLKTKRLRTKSHQAGLIVAEAFNQTGNGSYFPQLSKMERNRINTRVIFILASLGLEEEKGTKPKSELTVRILLEACKDYFFLRSAVSLGTLYNPVYITCDSGKR